MRYTGKIGEFKLWGFGLSLALSLLYAFFVYSRFAFVAEPPQEQAKATADKALARVQELEMQVGSLKAQMSALQTQNPSGQKTNRHR